MQRSLCLAALALLIPPTAGQAQDNRTVLPERPDAYVAATRAFVFYSDPRVNLHDFLMRDARADDPLEPRAQCLASLSRQDREAFDRARAYYHRTLSDQSWMDDLVLAIRWTLAGFPDAGEQVPEMATTLAHLRAAAPAYRACWWTDHDARNRAWIAEAVPRLRAHEEALLARLAVLYEDEWRIPFPVDIVGYTISHGANSMVEPDHILMSSTNPGYKGDSALEMLFHEASHTIVGPRGGAIWRALQNAGSTLQAESLSGELWHPIIFYTTGKVVQARLAEQGTAGYQPYMYRRRVFERFHKPLEQHWQPYLDGRVILDEAARPLLEALKRASQ